MTRAMTPPGVRPWCCSRSSWPLKVSLTDSMTCRKGLNSGVPGRSGSPLRVGRSSRMPCSGGVDLDDASAVGHGIEPFPPVVDDRAPHPLVQDPPGLGALRPHLGEGLRIHQTDAVVQSHVQVRARGVRAQESLEQLSLGQRLSAGHRAQDLTRLWGGHRNRPVLTFFHGRLVQGVVVARPSIRHDRFPSLPAHGAPDRRQPKDQQEALEDVPRNRPDLPPERPIQVNSASVEPSRHPWHADGPADWLCSWPATAFVYEFQRRSVINSLVLVHQK